MILKTVLQSIFFSLLINMVYIFGALVFGYISTVLYQPDIPESGNLYFIQQSVAFGYTGSFLTTFCMRTGIGAMLIFVLLRLSAILRAAK